ncbi:MAG: alpha/beta hydrolase [Alicyclobacillus sp.]|nr:alpha/beta hydrolase [Alicyclobacillus sp.]
MPLDPEWVQYVQELQKLSLRPVHLLTPQENRQQHDLTLQLRRRLAGHQPDLEDISSVVDMTVPVSQGFVRARLYTPQGVGPFPVLLYFHGGGFIWGHLDTVDDVCRLICREACVLVLSIDYRLAPEYKFPTQVEDSYAVLSWVAEHAAELQGRADRIAVGGDSAGGNLAAVVCLLAKERGGPPIQLQVLIYPPLLFSAERKNLKDDSQHLLLDAKRIKYFNDQYFRKPADLSHPYASLVLASDVSGLPPALIIAAEYDPLQPENELYAKKLAEAGVDVEYVCYAGMAHGFFIMPCILQQARRAVNHVSSTLHRNLS